MEDVQNVVVKLEEIENNWNENHLQPTAQSPLTADNPPSDAEFQNLVVKLEEIDNWDENPPQPNDESPSTADDAIHSMRKFKMLK